MSKYSVNNYTVSTLLGWIRDGQVAIPEIQRPFVWSTTKVRDLIDSLYKEYPVGYLITWKNPDVRLKDGSYSQGKNILIDGQQRVTALMAAISGEKVINKNYKHTRIKIAFNPQEETFEVFNAAIAKNDTWIPDISKIFSSGFSQYKFINSYVDKFPEVDHDQLNETLLKLINIKNNQIGIIELNQNLNIDIVNEIFVRINSKGTSLSQSDFVMSKIAVNTDYDGHIIRKVIDYFANVIKTPSNLEAIIDKDSEFHESEFYNKIKWVKNYESSIYVPEYTDILRVVFAFKFLRGRLSDLVSLLSGRNFETREYEERILEETFTTLSSGLSLFVNETNFKRFCMIIKSTGMISSKMISSQNNINFAYALYLLLREKGYEDVYIQKVVRKWFVLSFLTGRYSSSPESQIDTDIKRFNELDPMDYLARTEKGELGDSFWETMLPDNFSTTSRRPYFNVFLMSQVYNNSKAFLSDKLTVQQLIEERGDIHHIFPKQYLVKKGFNQQQYNQVANYVYAEQPINLKISDKAPEEYLAIIRQQIKEGLTDLGEINSYEKLEVNFKENAIPLNILSMDYNRYNEFLEERRNLMSDYVKEYYWTL